MSNSAQAKTKTPDRATFIRQCEADIETCIAEIAVELRAYLGREVLVSDRRRRIYQLHSLARDAKKIVNEQDFEFLDASREAIMSASIESGLPSTSSQGTYVPFTFDDLEATINLLDKQQVEGDAAHPCTQCGSNRKKRNGAKGMGACVNEACPDRMFDMRAEYAKKASETVMGVDVGPGPDYTGAVMFYVEPEKRPVNVARNTCPCFICDRVRKEKVSQ